MDVNAFNLSTFIENIGAGWFIVGIVISLVLGVLLLFVFSEQISYFLLFMATIYVNNEYAILGKTLWLFRWYILAILTLRALLKSKQNLELNWGLVIYALLILLAFINTPLAANPIRGFNFSFTMLALFIAFMVAYNRNIVTKEDLDRYFKPYLWMAITVSVLTLISFILGIGVASNKTTRFSSFLNNSSIMARALSLSAIVLLWKGLVTKKITGKMFFFTLLPITVTLLFFTGARGSLIFLAIVVLFLLTRYHVKLLMPLFGIILVAIMVIKPYIESMPQSNIFIKHITSESGSGRNTLAQQALGLIKEGLLIGHGTGKSTDPYDPIPTGNSFHNSYLDICVDMGIFGPLLWLLLIFGTFAIALKRCFDTTLPKDIKDYFWLIAASMIGFLIYGTVEGSPVNVSQFIHYWIIGFVAFAGAISRVISNEQYQYGEDLYNLQENSNYSIGE